jgi:hypothetical protein
MKKLFLLSALSLLYSFGARAQALIPQIRSCFNQTSQNKLIFPISLPNKTYQINLDVDHKILINNETITMIKGSSSTNVSIIDNKSLHPLKDRSSLALNNRMKWKAVYQYGDCLVFFVNHPNICSDYTGYCPNTPVLLNFKEGKAVTLGDKEFDRVEPNSVVFFKNQILIRGLSQV